MPFCVFQDDSLTDLVAGDVEEGWEPDDELDETDAWNISVNTTPMRRQLDQSLFSVMSDLNGTPGTTMQGKLDVKGVGPLIYICGTLRISAEFE